MKPLTVQSSVAAEASRPVAQATTDSIMRWSESLRIWSWAVLISSAQSHHVRAARSDASVSISSAVNDHSLGHPRGRRIGVRTTRVPRLRPPAGHRLPVALADVGALVAGVGDPCHL